MGKGSGAGMKNEKHEFLYHYARAAFDDELQRFRNIEDKAAKYLSFLSVGIVAYSLMLRFAAPIFFPPEGFWEWVTCMVIAVTYLALFTAWSFLYRALRFIEMPRLPLDESFIEDYEPRSLPTIHFALTRTCSTALALARAGNTEKSKLLVKGYREIGWAMWAFSISVILIVVMNFFQHTEARMAEEDKKNDQEQTSGEPDKDVPPPDVTFVLDHQNPELERKREQLNESPGKKSDE